MFIEKKKKKILGCKKIFFPMTHRIKEHVEIVKIYIVNINVTIFNSLKIFGILYIYGKFI